LAATFPQGPRLQHTVCCVLTLKLKEARLYIAHSTITPEFILWKILPDCNSEETDSESSH